MADLPPGVYKDKDSGIFHISVRLAGKQHHRSLDTDDEKKAISMAATIRELIHDLNRGKVEMPTGADVWEFLVSGGKRTQKLTVQATVTLTGLFDWYFANLPANTKVPKVLGTEGVHRRHFERILGKTRSLATISVGELQTYINTRARQKGQRGNISADTIAKEIDTLMYVWRLAHRQGRVAVSPPATNGGALRYPKSRAKPPFQTWQEIERTIAKNHLSEAERDDLWDSLWLGLDEIYEVLEFTRTHKTRSVYFYPVIVFAAHTGARLAEIKRSRMEDFKFDEKRVWLREMKSDTTKDTTRREVPLTSLLARVMQEYFAKDHPGGPYSISIKADKPMLESTLHEAFGAILGASKWKVLRGFHVFRHSFASNLAHRGEADRVIDKLMGHQTEEMRKRYQHLRRETGVDAVNKLFA